MTLLAEVAELADAKDLKSFGSKTTVRVQLPPSALKIAGIGAVGSARALGARGRQFESAIPDNGFWRHLIVDTYSKCFLD